MTSTFEKPVKFPYDLFSLASSTLKLDDLPQILVTRKLVNSVQNTSSPNTFRQLTSE